MQPVAGLAALTFAYALSQFFRVALAVIAPELALDLRLDADGLGLLASAWFLAFGLAQLPVGVALDRYGVRRTVPPMLVLAALGAVAMSAAHGLAGGLAAQALLGLGCSPIYMGTLVVLSRWYEPARFAMLSSLILAIGSTGNLLGTAPLAWLAGALGWRHALLAMAVLVLAAAILVGLLVRDGPGGSTRRRNGERLVDAIAGMFKMIGNPRLRLLIPIALTGYGTMLAVAGLWAGPYLAERFGLDTQARGRVLLAMSLGMILGPLAYAAIERRTDRRKLPVMVGSAVTILALGQLATTASLAVAALALVALGFFGSVFNLIMAQGRRWLGPDEIGRGLTFLNALCFGGAALLQMLTGAIASAADPPWAPVFLTLAAFLFIALLFLAGSRDRRLAELP
jgi:MFS family permease